MNKFPRGRTRLVAWTAAGVLGAGVLVGVADAATSNGASAGDSSLTAASSTSGQSPAGKANSPQSLARIEQKLAAGSVHGEIVLDTKKGLQTLDFQRGTVSGASAGSSGTFTVTDASGTAQTWTLSSSTKVRERKAKQDAGAASSAQLVDGETVVVIGLKADATLTARAVVIVPAKTGA
jgi:hypothetical protein